MTTAKRTLVTLSSAAALFTALAVAPGQAEAHRRRWGVWVHVHRHPAPPPPPPVYSYAPPPPPATAYAPAPVPWSEPYPRLGLSLAGTVQGGGQHDPAIGGVAGTLQMRTSRHTLLGVELQSVGVRRADYSERNDLAALLAGRVFFWDADFAPYLELAGGLGRSSLELDGLHVRASQLLGRVGVGLELRLGRHIALDGQIAQLHRLRLGEDEHGHLSAAAAVVTPFEEHERATEVRGGLTVRF